MLLRRLRRPHPRRGDVPVRRAMDRPRPDHVAGPDDQIQPPHGGGTLPACGRVLRLSSLNKGGAHGRYATGASLSGFFEVPGTRGPGHEPLQDSCRENFVKVSKTHEHGSM